MRSTSGTVFVFGSINADTSYRMPTLPTPGETVIASSAQASPGGKGANQAIAAAAAGANTRMIGAVGTDPEAAGILRALSALGIDTATIDRRPAAATGRAVVCVDNAGENLIVVLSGANDQVDGQTAATGLATIEQHDVLVLQNEVPAAANRAAARLARAAGATVIWNAAPAPATEADLVHDVDLLVVNEHELIQLGHLLNLTAANDLVALLNATARALNTDAICTLGAAGALFDTREQTGRVPALRVRAIDTTAAGDTVVGYLAAHAALPMAERLRLASAAGALTVTRAGASSSIPPLHDVERMLDAPTERTME